jgi:hypothetical protein
MVARDLNKDDAIEVSSTWEARIRVYFNQERYEMLSRAKTPP